jgi:pimeloyl-ACP methyl ester carboxylesterase
MTEEEIEARRARMAVAPAQTDEDREAVVENTIRTIFKDPSRVPASYRDDLRWQMRVADPAMAGQFGTLFEGMARERFDQIRIPTLVVFGEADAMIPIERGCRLAAAIPGAQFVGIPDAGHTCQIELPDAFVAAVTPFLDETNEKA